MGGEEHSSPRMLQVRQGERRCRQRSHMPLQKQTFQAPKTKFRLEGFNILFLWTSLLVDCTNPRLQNVLCI